MTSTLCPAQVVSRSNSDMLTIDALIQDTTIPPDVRMELVWQVAQDWDRATDGSSGRFGSQRRAPKYLAARNKRIAAEYRNLMAAKTDK